MNYHKKGLRKLLGEILDGNIGRLVLVHQDRLLRFGAELVFATCQAKQVEVVIINQGKDRSFEEELATDFLEIISMFRPGCMAPQSQESEADRWYETRRQGCVMLTAHQIRLDPNNVQATYFARAAGTARFAYNWALEEWGCQYQAHLLDPTLPKPNEAALRRQLNAIKRAEFPWMLEVTKCAPQAAIQQLGKAFENFFAKRCGYPIFRRKGINDRFTISNDQFEVQDKHIRIPKLGWVRMRECLRFTGRMVSACICRIADHWYASITVDTLEERLPPPSENQGAVGVDLGVSNLATLSTGEVFTGSKALRHARKQLRRLSKDVSRKVKGSRNRHKAKRRLARQHARVANIRSNDSHQITTSITRRFHTIGIEDLNVKGMLGNRCLSRAIADMSFGEFRRQLEYKAQWRGGQVVVVDRWYPSSKTCSCCGVKIETLTLAQRHWACQACGATHDRDVNAAINLRDMAVSSTVSACGGEGAGPARERTVKPAPVKQEFNSKASFE